ncbi:TRAP transporter large permease [Bacillus sinesaloumensis]|uniref:TRAP transporter large permease n=1 Tax=Litchfieldia sinesaloumensis TaxID=1926280 RepID=UPI000988452D|nr:TRAP transporter large permease [Bacillus sinesaloumensis]
MTTGTIILLVSFIVLLLLRFPVAVVLALSSLITAIYLGIPLEVIGQRIVQGINSYGLLAIPFFILAGMIMSEGGLAMRLVNFAQLFVGAIRGGLAMVNCIACMLFGNISGSAAADVASVGSVMIPTMKKKGYDADFSVAITSAAAIQGTVMPPSYNMILYAVAAGGVSISSLFLAGIIPCLLMLTGLLIATFFISKKRGYEKGEGIPLRDAPKIIKDGFLSLLTGVIILGGIFSGWFTPTESGAIACIYAYIITFFVYKDLPLKHSKIIFLKTFRTVSMVLFLIASSAAFAWILTYLKIPHLLAETLLSISDNPLIILLIINILLLLLGSPMDMAPLILIMTPILFPIVTALGVDPVHFGIIMIMNLGIGLITPPVGTVLFVGAAIGKVSIERGAKALIPLYFVLVVVLLIVTYIPSISMWLPNLMSS